MQFLKNVLKSPIRNTLLFFGVSLIAYLLFALTSLYLTRVMCAALFDATGSCRGTNLQMFISMILSDLELVFRITSELSIIVLVSQVFHRLATRRSK